MLSSHRRAFKSDLLEKSALCLLTIIHWMLKEAYQWERLWRYRPNWLYQKCLFNLLSYMVIFLLNEENIKENEVLWMTFLSVLSSYMFPRPCSVMVHFTRRREDRIFFGHIDPDEICYFGPSCFKKAITFSMTL